MTTHICIEILHGGSNVQEEDRERAEAAAMDVIEAAGTIPATAYAEYRRQWLKYDDEEAMTGAALIWVAAQNAADLALTAGWHNPAGAACAISA